MGQGPVSPARSGYVGFMATIFTKIIEGDIPGHFVWKDETCVAFLVIDPITDGHTVVVPREEVVEWTVASPELLTHLMGVAQTVGQAQQEEWGAQRIGLLAEGYEVPHLHLHVWPTQSPADFDPHDVVHGQDQQILAENACRLRERLRQRGAGEVVPAEE